MAPKVHKSSIFQAVEADQPKSKLSISRLLHSVHVDNKNTCVSIKNAIKTYIDEHNENVEQSSFSGFLIQRDNIVIHFVESENKNIEKFLEYMRAVNKTLKTPMTFLVLAFNEKYADRVFEHWGTENVLTGESVYPHSNIAEEKVEERIWSVYEKFLNAGKAVRRKLREEGLFSAVTLKQAMDHLQISAEEIEGMFSGFSFTLDEYFSLYHESNNILLDNEFLWPTEGYVSELIEFSKEPYTEINGTNLI